MNPNDWITITLAGLSLISTFMMFRLKSRQSQIEREVEDEKHAALEKLKATEATANAEVEKTKAVLIGWQKLSESKDATLAAVTVAFDKTIAEKNIELVRQLTELSTERVHHSTEMAKEREQRGQCERQVARLEGQLAALISPGLPHGELKIADAHVENVTVTNKGKDE